MSDDTADANEKERSATTFHARPMPNFTKITVSIHTIPEPETALIF